MNSAQYLDAIRARHNLPSDYAVAKLLNVKPARLSNYRRGVSDFDEDLIPKIAELVGSDPVLVFADVSAARAKSTFARNAFAKLADMARAQASAHAATATATAGGTKKGRKKKKVEARVGIEPAYADLQSAA